METKDKIAIYNLRMDGCGYVTISNLTGINVNTVKSYCRRHGLGSGLQKSAKIELDGDCETEVFCKNCGKRVKQNHKRKKKMFCNDKCRMDWWNNHREMVKHRTSNIGVCKHCGKEIILFGKTQRKYCSHECYILDRFGEK